MKSPTTLIKGGLLAASLMVIPPKISGVQK